MLCIGIMYEQALGGVPTDIPPESRLNSAIHFLLIPLYGRRWEARLGWAERPRRKNDVLALPVEADFALRE